MFLFYYGLPVCEVVFSGGLLKSLPNVVGFNHNIWPSVLVLVFIVALDLCEAPQPTSKAV